ncbi:MAG TPA: PIN domain-containing protein [Candidatus Woesebacteria bacterium]|nr:PIN domain-containing protein [Candidatus Woesebacteria bacterium]
MFVLDTDFIIALRFPQESTHQRAVTYAKKYLKESESFVTDLVQVELANVISRKYSQEQAIQAIRMIQKAPNGTLYLDKENISSSWELFFQQKKRGMSVVDCSNTIVAKKLGFQIVSFDTFYREFDLLVAGM